MLSVMEERLQIIVQANLRENFIDVRNYKGFVSEEDPLRVFEICFLCFSGMPVNWQSLMLV